MNYTDLSNKLTVAGEESTSVTGEEAVMNSLNNIILTPVGSMPGHPEFGSGIGKYLFQQLDPLVEQLIEQEIRYSIKRWEPRVVLTEVIVTGDPDYNRIVIKVIFTIISDPQNEAREFIFKVDTNA